jgi:Peptidase inhibitor I78 family
MMQFRVMVVVTSALGLTACNPWFDYAPKSVGEETVAAIKGNSVPPLSQTCPAKDLQYLVGQPRSVLATMRFGSEVRFEEPGQAYTQDFVATRTRIIIGPDGKISRILCG